MVELGQWKPKMATPEITASRSPTPPSIYNNNPLPPSPRVQDASDILAYEHDILAYEHYLRLPELTKLFSSKNFADWSAESILKPALQALEITFRLVSISLSDPRLYTNHREWKRRLESLAARQIEIISILCEDECGGVPIADLTVNEGVLTREQSSQEVWKLNGTASTLVSHTSEASLLPRLAAWDRSEDVASKILYQIECQMRRCHFTLGLGEPNLAGKPSLEYDLIVRPSDLHSLKKSPLDRQLKNNRENQPLFTIHHILEAWLCTARQLLKRIGQRIDGSDFDKAAGDCWILERIWRLLSEAEDLHLLMDPDDFLHLKSQLGIRATSSAFCFRSRALFEVTDLSRDLKHKVPRILGVEVDPNGGPRVQEAAMRLFHSRRRGDGDSDSPVGRLHLLQAFQAIEAAIKKFFFAYRQLITAVMGSLEANGNRGLMGFSAVESSDSLTQMFMDPPYFPSLDAAKTFLGEFWRCESNKSTANAVIHDDDGQQQQ